MDLYFKEMNFFENMVTEIIVDHDTIIKNNLLDLIFLEKSEIKISDNSYLKIFLF